MSDSTHITPQQEAILSSFTCQRLTADPANQQRIRNFYSARNKGLTAKLREDAWFEDSDGVPAAYYVVKSADGQIALFFSLKCGTLCDLNYVARVFARFEQTRDLMAALDGEESTPWAQQFLEELRNRQGSISYLDRMTILTKYLDAADARKDIGSEKEDDPGDHLIRVDEAFPAVELVHFCANDNFRKQWAALNLGRNMGEVFFWRFVLPKMLEVRKLVGCEYAYLFAADTSMDGTLVNYYETALHFQRLNYIGGIKPWYDYFCKFMCKRLLPPSDFRKRHLKETAYTDEDTLGLVDHCAYFFAHFNEVPTLD